MELVCKLAVAIYKEYGADYTVVVLAALFHNVASVTNKDYAEKLHIIRAQIAGELLGKYDLPIQMIEHIQKYILNYRGSKLADKSTPEEVCIADADAMTHFYDVPSLLRMVYIEKGLSIEEVTLFVLNKLECSYNKLFEKVKEVISPHYEAAKVLLKRKF